MVKGVELDCTNLMETLREVVLMVRPTTTEERPAQLLEAWNVLSGRIIVCTVTATNPAEMMQTLTTVEFRIMNLGPGVTLRVKTKDGTFVTSLMVAMQVGLDA